MNKINGKKKKEEDDWIIKDLMEMSDDYIDIEDYGIAIIKLKDVLKAKPQNFTALFNLGVIYATIGVNNKAIEYWKKCLEIFPQYLKTFFYLGRIYFRLEQYNESIKYYEEIIKIDPLNKFVFYNLGNCSINIYKYQDAIEYYESALSIDKFDFGSYINLAKCYEKRGDLNYTIRILKEIIENFLEDNILLDKLGKIYIELEDFKDAFDCYEKMIKTNPYDEQAEKKIKILISLLQAESSNTNL